MMRVLTRAIALAAVLSNAAAAQTPPPPPPPSSEGDRLDGSPPAAPAEAYYQFAMQRSRTLRHGSGLGLARIWAEGEMLLTRAYDGDDVRITATAEVRS